MAESMQGLKRSHRCAEVSNALEGQKVTVMGWVQKSRNKGGIIFVDLRDRSGILQIIFEESKCGSECFEKATKLKSEYVAAIEGTVCKRAGAVNENLTTGDIEVVATSLRILSEAETPPFPIEENSKTKEELRLKYRYLDLRSEPAMIGICDARFLMSSMFRSRCGKIIGEGITLLPLRF